MSCCAPGCGIDARYRPGLAKLALGRGDQACEPLARRRSQSDRPVGAGRSLRRLHPGDRDGARASSTASRARASTCRPSASRCAGATDDVPPLVADAEPASAMLRICSTVNATEKDETLAELIRAVAVAGFAASNIMLLVGLGLVGRGRRDTRSLPLGLGADRHSRAGLCRAHLLPLGLERAQPRAHEHGRADRARRLAGLRHEPLRDDQPWRPCLFRRGRLAAVLPADRPHARPCHARPGAHRGAGPGAPRAARRPGRPNRRLARVPAGRQRSSRGMQLLVAAGERIPVDARVVARHVGSRLLAGHRRKRAAAGSTRHAASRRHAEPHRRR